MSQPHNVLMLKTVFNKYEQRIYVAAAGCRMYTATALFFPFSMKRDKLEINVEIHLIGSFLYAN